MISQAPPDEPVALPCNEATERHVLASILVDGKCFPRVRRILRPDDFYSAPHRKLYQAMSQTFAEKGAIDLPILLNDLKAKGMLEGIGEPYLLGLCDVAPHAANVEIYAMDVQEHSLLRKIITGCQWAIRNASGQRPSREIVGELGVILTEVTRTEGREMPKRLRDILVDVLDLLDQRFRDLQAGRGSLPGVPSGFSALDHWIGTFRPGELTILAGYPSHGKSSLARDIMLNAGTPKPDKASKRVFMVCLEDTMTQVGQNIYSRETGLSSWAFNTLEIPPTGWKQISAALTRLQECGIWVYAPGNLSALELRTQLLALGEPMDMVIVDYLQLMDHPPGERLDLRIGSTTRSLKQMAKDFNLAVVVLSQLSRASAKENRPPQLRDLRDSGSIEADADVVLMLDRPTLRVATEAEREKVMKEYGWNAEDLESLARVWIRKQRHGPTSFVDLVFHGDIASFGDMPLQKVQMEF